MEKMNTKDKKSQKTKSYFLLLTSYFLPNKNKKGQVAVILILVVAVALIFYAISLNLGRISQAKTAVTIAADTSASLLASYMASFGESLFETSLEGKKKVCGYTGLYAAVLAAIIVIIAVVAAAFTGGASLGLLSYVAIILALGAVAMQALTIQPGITNSYNNIIWHSMGHVDSFTEQGVQTGLTGAVTDSAQVADLNDSDGDSVWGLDITSQPLDRISRFGFYYRQMRIGTIPPLPEVDVLSFLNELRNFLTDDGDGWGIYDKTGPQCDPFAPSSECDSCCVPLNDTAGNPYNPSLRPQSCGTDAAAILANCRANSPYGANYPWVYDPYRENPLNNDSLSPNPFISFREQLGRDDEHQIFEKNPADPNGVQTAVLLPPPPLPPTNFQLEDATAYYPSPTENRAGVFPFFYKIADWGVDLKSLVTNDPANPQCNWCDPRAPVGVCTATYPPEFPQLNLPVDPAGVDPVTGLPLLSYNTTYCVDGTNLVGGNPPLAADLVRLPDPDIIPFVGNPRIGKIEAAPPQCAQTADTTDPGRRIGFWKRGGDRFCSDTLPDGWPYWGECRKYRPGSCTVVIDPVTGEMVDPGCACGEADTDPAEWPDDVMDALVYGLNDFIKWANSLLAKNSTTLAKEFKNWYPEAAAWIEPGSGPSPAGSDAVSNPACATCCFLCAAEDGTLYKWYKAIMEMEDRLKAWRDASSFAGGGCRDVWCVPPDLRTEAPPYKSCTSMFPTPPPAAEEATFDSNNNGTRGDMEDIVACLDWNANDTITFGGTSAIGNTGKFQECKNACAAGNYDAANFFCANLPRSLVPEFDTSAYVPTEIAELVACRDVVCPGAPAPPPPTFCTAYGHAYNCVADLAAIQAAIDVRVAAGSCTDVIPGCACDATGCNNSCGFMDLVQKSIPEAENQGAKFQQRYKFLKGRLDEMDNFIGILDAARIKFEEFLTCPNGAACTLIKARINASDSATGLPYHAIYGWQSEPEQGQPAGSGKWHIVRADARIPEKCDRDCKRTEDQTSGVDGDPAWPYVHTYTKKNDLGIESKRCYELRGTDGIVKARVSRFDETSTFATLLFPNAVEIWKPTFERGDRPLTASPDDIEARCLSSMVPDPGQAFAVAGSYYYGAFILNERLTNIGCWDLANELLAGGVTSEACAQYYFHDGTPKGMDFKFVPCPEF